MVRWRWPPADEVDGHVTNCWAFLKPDSALVAAAATGFGVWDFPNDVMDDGKTHLWVETDCWTICQSADTTANIVLLQRREGWEKGLQEEAGRVGCRALKKSLIVLSR